MLHHLADLRRRRLSPETIRQRMGRVHDMLAAIGTFDPAEITPQMLNAWQDSLLRYSPATQGAYASHARAWLRWCYEHGECPVDLSSHVVRPKVPRALPRPISEADLELAMTTADVRMRAMLTLSAFAGLRAGEIARLARADVLDSSDPPILIVRQGKGSKDRVVPLCETALDALHVWGMRRPWVFPGKSGHLSPTTVSNRISEHLHSVGIDATSHQGRHRFLTELYRASKDLRLCQEVAGHASPQTTAVYTGFSAERGIDAVRALDHVRQSV